MNVDVLSWDDAVERILTWASARESRSVCICNVHNVVTALQIESHAHSLKAADMVTADGAPVAWMLRRLGYGKQDRISGPDLMIKCCQRAAETGEKIFLYGGSPATLARLEEKLRQRFPTLDIVGAYSPPFRELTDEEDAAVVEMINRSGAGVVWIGLGCPKQESWMFKHRGKVNAVMVGVGAAFDFHAGTIKRAPLWMQRSGLEWLHRLSQDPRRLAKRYLVTNTIFLLGVLKEFGSGKWGGQASSHLRRPADVPDKS